MRKTKKFLTNPARRNITFAWPLVAAAVLAAVVAARWPKARHTPVRAPGPGAPLPRMAFVEIPAGAKGFLWPRNFTHGLGDGWPRELDMATPVQQPPPPLPFRAWPADETP